MSRLLLALSLLLGAPSVAAQDDDAFVELELRVISTPRPGMALVDRGASDFVEKGDVVLLRPRGGGTFQGAVVKRDERSALVRLTDPSFVPEAGMRGVVLVPASRFPEEAESTPEDVPDHPPWQNTDDTWSPGQPLLAEVSILRPEERPTRVHGRFYAIADQTWGNEDDRNDSFYRAGFDVEYENPFGHGGGLHWDAELNHRSTEVPDRNDRDFSKLRIDRLSYAWGGTRFNPERQEVGRFLQHGIPEFGVLDGYEWGHRFDDGVSIGASVGAMPEPNADFSTGDDVQFAGYYRWSSDESERYSIAGGYQKTWHNGAPDRDLFVGKVHYLPEDGWNVQGTAWIDYYSSERAKDSGPELTQAHVSATRNYDDGGHSWVLSRLRFPELERDEFLPVTLHQLAHDRRDRLAYNIWGGLDDDVRVNGGIALWDDEDETGGDVEFGIDLADRFQEDSLSTVTIFYLDGEFSEGRGARLSYGRSTDEGRWDVSYEVSTYANHGFSSDFDDVTQHWLRYTKGFYLDAGWDVSLSIGGRIWDDEASWTTGVYVSQRF